jgi:hypothetical protein
VTADSSVALGRIALYQLLILKDAYSYSWTLAVPALPAIVITGLDVAPPPRAAALLLRKEELTRERLAFAIRRVNQVTR